MVDKKCKVPKKSNHITPKNRTPSIQQNPESNRHYPPAWQLGLVDKEGAWGWQGIGGSFWWDEIHKKLADFESMTWQEILDASGGRGSGNGNNSHEVSLDKLSLSARKRLKDLGHRDIDELFSLRLKGKERIWGILDGRILKIIWFDANHEVCPSIK